MTKRMRRMLWTTLGAVTGIALLSLGNVIGDWGWFAPYEKHAVFVCYAALFVTLVYLLPSLDPSRGNNER